MVPAGTAEVFAKLEYLNPGFSKKDRIAREMMLAACQRGELTPGQTVVELTSGNTGTGLALVCRALGHPFVAVMSKGNTRERARMMQALGAEVVLVDGLISDAARAAGERARAEGWFDVSTFKEPYRVEGKKIMGYELAEGFEWELPDVILYPTGGGTGLVGMCKAFDELEALCWLKNTKRPRMVAVQAEGCAPVVKAFHEGATNCEFWMDAHTLASGLRVPKSFADALILRDLRATNGTAVSVSDEAILEAQRALGKLEGIFAAPEGAATLAALRELVKQKWIETDERVVLFNTGTGLKYLD